MVTPDHRRNGRGWPIDVDRAACLRAVLFCLFVLFVCLFDVEYSNAARGAGGSGGVSGIEYNYLYVYWNFR